ncbi:Dihydrolipoamide acetyltransferase component of pyruvate dehydrogenase complex [Flavobacterium sp. 9AF]|uniref:dihydrolipoamide acetyltransferase family protein n=1 Tax=Flavobacterium sp. 9AF TaxID=2653142 RepID=UPI0012F21EA3|nr:dihydrolipoamide acetyltransferase family protein [Flavobacterium sp. 9AF]VXC24375.1 Dihydrolipoamide acetyltransferase component of pyruvate dehydrogenase complex [Flavobacterium sp. 9AF]
MAKFELKLPKMGESVAEATVTNWLKKVGDRIEMDEAVLEIATDKVDSEVPSEVAGTLVEILFNVDDVVQVGQTIAIIETEGGSIEVSKENVAETTVEENAVETINQSIESAQETTTSIDFSDSNKFYSPLVRNIAKEEGVTLEELEVMEGSGKGGRVNKEDILNYIKERNTKFSIPKKETISPVTISETKTASVPEKQQAVSTVVPTSVNGADEIVEMDRMRKLISKYMVESVQTSAHVQSFIEVDVTNIVKWRDKVKGAFEKREGEKLTFTPIFMEVVAKALKDFPGMNISVDGEYIIKKKNINLGMAAALPNGNLIVPVIKNADQLNLVGMAKTVNDLANRARIGKLKPDDTQGGTYTVTNVGTFGSVFGTPIINQPQVGILALGAIRKVPAVIETPEGDFIGIRQKMFLSHSYDHRVVDGALGGSFVKRVAEYLEAWDINRDI